MSDNIKMGLDGVSIVTTLATILTWLPHIAAFLGVVWWAYRLYETHLSVKILKKKLREEYDNEQLNRLDS